ncbi:Peptidoglycan/xylan/chitin deacetylase, PgdA/CDA1 family [Halogranum rubrum]|uniref:Peptidoglycan/xylan/chitin deacetylase, PgdA/CDA1 family n=1 Tax=Halogranum rubrum TaxID=553466 RepID=A0A1I4HAP8_9EURY|nr:DUF2334 domain-containing protein [Halogranum rubrum]SFL39235.1 Peptidoglycan/xylan/chitin deacetylase, PgdA/CDA1 family [Halogranum rubrum]
MNRRNATESEHVILQKLPCRLDSSFGGRTLRTSLTLCLLLLVLSSAVVTPVGAVSQSEAQPSSDGEWKHHQSIVIFRNDDIQPYYRQPEMRAVDQVFVDEGVPVTQGVIPTTADGAILSEGQLCQYIRTQSTTHPDTFEYVLHGYTHNATTTFYGGSEFGDVAYATQYQQISDGTDILESCTGERSTTFIPPFDTYDNNTVRALTRQNYTAISGGGWFTIQYYNESEPFETGGMLHVPNSHSFVKDWSADELYTEEELEEAFDATHQNNGVYVQMLHYPTFTDESRLQTLRGLIHHMKSREGVRFMTLGEFAERSQQGKLERVDDGWLVWESNTLTETSEPELAEDSPAERPEQEQVTEPLAETSEEAPPKSGFERLYAVVLDFVKQFVG